MLLAFLRNEVRANAKTKKQITQLSKKKVFLCIYHPGPVVYLDFFPL